MNVVTEIQRLNERELELNVPLSGSWHAKYRDSAWIFIGGLSFELSEGDVLCVLSQFGEVEDLHLVRDRKTGKSRGFAFLKYDDQRSTILAVDNLNNWKLLDRVLRVDHVLKYKLPQELQDDSDADSSDEERGGGGTGHERRRSRGLPGHAYEGKALASDFDLHRGVDVFAAAKQKTEKKQKKKEKKEKQEKKESVEQRQQQVVAHVLAKRREQRQQEEREGVSSDGKEVVVQPSATGWRGRLEPSAKRPRRECEEEGQEPEREGRGKQRCTGYGGLSRTR
ncbi:unnamed protein product [Hyaloperonospora brassicae]|uniref:RRM domain-containing protein n=1 Tax=Hyaloperonospora brassicae TaxID=162125 RepID=A0AAV0SXP8_HYABA|nr:unnamed protein product [Hyaloperonospora brassicae]